MQKDGKKKNHKIAKDIIYNFYRHFQIITSIDEKREFIFSIEFENCEEKSKV